MAYFYQGAFTFTRPIYKDGSYTKYFRFLLSLEKKGGKMLTWKAETWQPNGFGITLQHLRQAGLIAYTKDYVVLTPNGYAYIQKHLR